MNKSGKPLQKYTTASCYTTLARIEVEGVECSHIDQQAVFESRHGRRDAMMS